MTSDPMARACGLDGETMLPEAQAAELLLALSRPSEPHWKTRAAGGFRDLFFLTTLDKTPAFAASIGDLAGKRDYPSRPHRGLYSAHSPGHELPLRVQFLLRRRHRRRGTGSGRHGPGRRGGCGPEGGFFSRPYLAWRQTAYRRAPAAVAMQKKIKKIFDPKGILNPGKLCF